MPRITSLASVASLALCVGVLGLSATPAHAQQNPLAGVWQCEQSNYTIRNLPADNFSIRWIMELRPDGTLVAEGSFFGAVSGYSEGIQGQGRWMATDQGLGLNLQWILGGQAIPAEYSLRNAGPQMVDNGTGEAGQYSISCQRAGD